MADAPETTPRPEPPPGPSAPSAPPEPDRPEKLPWFPKRKKFLIPLVLLLSAIIFGLAIGLVVAFTSNKQTEPYKLTMRTLQDSPQVRQHVGVPFEAGWAVLGNVKADDGTADLMFKITGPVGEGAVRSHAELVDGQWVIEHLDLGIGGRKDGQVITLIGDPDELPISQ